MTDPERSGGRGGGPRRTILTMRLGGQTFALGVERVREIIDPLPMTCVPGADPDVPGLINVRGSVVPVLALARRLGMAPGSRTADSRVVVLDLTVSSERAQVAVMADSVDGVIEVEDGAIEPVPEIGIEWPARFIEGIARLDGDLVILLKTDTVFAHAGAGTHPPCAA